MTARLHRWTWRHNPSRPAGAIGVDVTSETFAATSGGAGGDLDAGEELILADEG